MLNAPIILLKEGTVANSGVGHIRANVDACMGVVDMVRTTLGPRGMDKLMKLENGVISTNDGATIAQNLEVVHPVASMMVDVACSQDKEVGDGTTSALVLCGALLSEAKDLLDEGVQPRVVVRGYEECGLLVREILKRYVIPIEIPTEPMGDFRVPGGIRLGDLKIAQSSQAYDTLRRVASTAMNSKLVAAWKGILSDMVVRAVLGAQLSTDAISIKKVAGGSISDTILVSGVAFKKTFSYAGYEKQPKRIENGKVLCLNVELELKAEKDNAEVRLSSVSEYDKIVKSEWNIIFGKLDKIAASGANIVLSKLAIGDLATQYFSERSIYCAGRVESDDLDNVCSATGAALQHCVNPTSKCLGMCDLFEERQIGAERYEFIHLTRPGPVTIVLRGGAPQFIDETARSLHDAIMVTRRLIEHPSIVPGAGSIEMELSKELKNMAQKFKGKSQLVAMAYAKSLECIPRTLCQNSGYDPNTLLGQLRQVHAEAPTVTTPPKGGPTAMGIDCLSNKLMDAYAGYVWELSLIKSNALSIATEAAIQVLLIDETLRCPPSQPQE